MHKRERERERERENVSIYNFSKSFEYENGFYLTSMPYRLGNIMAHYELYKRIINLPGDILEFGVFKGSSFIQFCTFRELLENENSRKIIGFDTFSSFPLTSHFESDKDFIDKWNSGFADSFLSRDDLFMSLAKKGIGNFDLIEGNILNTLDEYLSKFPHTRISLLHIDTDVYEPAKYILQKCYTRVISGGIIIFDDYGTIEGETCAVDEFFADKKFTLKKFPFSHSKPSYIIKDHVS
jgi:hypothetical protein